MGLQHTDSCNAAQILAVWNSLVLEQSITQILNSFCLDRPCDLRIKRLNLICHSVYMWVEKHSVYMKSSYELVKLHTVFEYGRIKWLSGCSRPQLLGHRQNACIIPFFLLCSCPTYFWVGSGNLGKRRSEILAASWKTVWQCKGQLCI